jgi:hypothetical protein
MTKWQHSRVYAASFIVSAIVFSSAARAQCETWGTEFGASTFYSETHALATFDDGSGPALWIGGDVALSGPGNVNVLRWNGSSWLPTGGLGDTVLAFAVFDAGNGPAMYAGGYFAGGGLAVWDGSTWIHIAGLVRGTANPWVNVMATFNSGAGDELYIGGAFLGACPVVAKNLIRWNGSAWSDVGGGLGPRGSGGPQVNALQVFDDGSGPALFVGGLFGSAGGTSVSSVAKWNGTQWSAASAADLVTAFAVYNDGTGPALYAGGSFFGGTARVARWDGTNWIGLPNPLMLLPEALIAVNEGSGQVLYAGGGAFGGCPRIDKWDGHTWSALGSGPNATVWALGAFGAPGNDPDVFVGGQFTRVGGGVHSNGLARWIVFHGTVASMCPGDATLAGCPCSNSGQSGRGCDNSVASGGAQLSATGMTSPDTLVLTSSGELSSALSIFLQGDVLASTVQMFGDGLRCTGGQLLRLYVKSASGGVAQAPEVGDPSISARSAMLGDSIAPGSIRYYQTYYRDPSTSFCASPQGGTFNVSSGMRIIW